MKGDFFYIMVGLLQYAQFINQIQCFLRGNFQLEFAEGFGKVHLSGYGIQLEDQIIMHGSYLLQGSIAVFFQIFFHVIKIEPIDKGSQG